MTNKLLSYISLLLVLTACGDAIEEVSRLTPNIAPVANNDEVTTYRNTQTVEIAVLANDNDPENKPVTIVSFTEGRLGSVTKTTNDSGSILAYKPELNRSGIDTFTYTIQDHLGKASEATVTVNISAWSAPVKIGNGTDIKFATGLDGKAVAAWKNAGSLFSSRFLHGVGWQTAIPIYTTGTAGSIASQSIVVSGVGQVLTVWKSVEDLSTLFGYGVLVNSQWQISTTPWPNANADQATSINLSIDNNGMASLVWDQKGSANSNTIWQNMFTPQNNWSTEDTAIAQTQADAQSPVSITHGDRTAVAWLQDSPATVWWRYKNNTEWELPVPLSNTAQSASNVQITMGQSGTGLIVWQAKNSSETIRLNARTFTYLEGSIPVLDQAFPIDNGEGNVSGTQLVKNTAGDTVLAWRQLSTEGSAIWTYRITGPNRILEKVSINDNNFPENPTVSLNENGEIFVLWREDEQLLFRKYETAWQPIETLANTPLRPGRSLSMGSDGLGNAVAIWNAADEQSTIWSSDYCQAPENCQQNTSTHPMVNQACVNCHNGTDVTGKPDLHLPTLDMCNICHNDSLWKPAKFNHSGTAEPCNSCHDGISYTYTSKPDGHWTTTLDCAYCHVPPNWLPSFVPSHANYASTECVSCHDGVVTSGKSSNHMPTRNYCGDCHHWADAPWKNIRRVDHGVVIGNCSSCHNGTVAKSKKNVNHIPTSNICEDCHDAAPRKWKPIRQMDHLSAFGTCFSCHDGITAKGKGQLHITSDDVCESCHNTTKWLNG